MRESLKHLFNNHVTLEDNSQYNYSINPYELKNALGSTIAILQEYHFTKANTTDPFLYKLYRTKDGNWYDIEEANAHAEKTILRMLKSAVDHKEAHPVTKISS
jgi:hypothetical protein